MLLYTQYAKYFLKYHGAVEVNTRLIILILLCADVKYLTLQHNSLKNWEQIGAFTCRFGMNINVIVYLIQCYYQNILLIK